MCGDSEGYFGCTCRRHAARYEKEFREDMSLLGCRPPDILTRVSEYMDEIRDYVDRIFANGMAYAVKGSVYFDSKKYTCAALPPCAHPKSLASVPSLAVFSPEGMAQQCQNRCQLYGSQYLWKHVTSQPWDVGESVAMRMFLLHRVQWLKKLLQCAGTFDNVDCTETGRRATPMGS
jgi:hypothetical protein